MAKKTKELVERNPLEIIADLQILISTAGWQIIREVMQGNVATLNEMILNKTIDGKPESTEISDQDVDQLRYKRGFMIDLMNTPENYIEKLQDKGIEPEEFDPYFKDAKEIIADRRSKK